MNRQQLLSRLGHRGWPIVYSTGALNLWHRGSKEWRAAPLVAHQREMDGVRVDLAGRFLPVWPSRTRYSTWAIARYCASLKRRSAFLKKREGIAYVFSPEFLPYARALGCRYLVYHVVDDYAQTPGWTPQLEEMEGALVARADLLIGAAAPMLARLRPSGSVRQRVLHNGADAAAFARGVTLPCPTDLERIPQPRICYTGRLNRKVDFNLIYAIAHVRPAWQWILIGPVSEGAGDPARDPLFAEAFAACRHLPNVHFLGEKPVDVLPRYVGHADVNVMCYRTDSGGWWNSVYPLKLHEYLASGKPVISAPLASVQPFAHVVEIASSVADWISAIERALSHGGLATPGQRLAIANENTWDLRVDQLEQWLCEMIDAGERHAAPAAG